MKKKELKCAVKVLTNIKALMKHYKLTKNQILEIELDGEDYILHTDRGICYHFDKYLELVCDNVNYTEKLHGKLRNALFEHFKSWKHYSGNESFPINPRKDTLECFDNSRYSCAAEQFYYVSPNMFKGLNYKRRLSLINHCISQFKKDIKKSK